MTNRAHNAQATDVASPLQSLSGRHAGVGSIVLGRFRIVRVLAQGGMGEVFLARSEGAAGFVRPVVIKRSLGTSSSETIEMFAREARILSNLHHPGIVGIVDFAKERGDYTMVLDYVHGYTLAQWIRFSLRNKVHIPVPLAVYCVVKILEALQYAHSLSDSSGTPLGIVHRDIKPSNVLVDVQGIVKIADFGIARADADATRTEVAGTLLKGTLSYMAPELFAGDKPSPASDVYSTAVTAYQLLTGVNPFYERNPVLAVARAANFDPRPASELHPEVPAAISEIVAKGMRKTSNDRYGSAGEMAAALREHYPIDGVLEVGFRNAVQRAFNDPNFAAINKTDSLVQREAAWSVNAELIDLQAETSTATVTVSEKRPVDGERQPAGERAVANGTEPLPRVRTEPPRARSVVSLNRSRLVLAVGVGIGICMSALAVAFVLWNARLGASPTEAVVMVKGDVAMERDRLPSPVAEPVATATGALPVEVSPAAKSPAGEPAASVESDKRARASERRVTEGRSAAARRRGPRSLAHGLTATFRRHEPDITSCFDQFSTPPSGIDGLAVRFQVAKSGRVVAASLIPDTISDQPLGKCLLSVARTARFDEQDSELQFRIPIKVAGRR